ncbi:hypothetical protein MRX96_002931 [Rhipicephalus microplus]
MISSNMTANSSGQSSKKDQFSHETKPPPCLVMTPPPNLDESLQKNMSQLITPLTLLTHTPYVHAFKKPQPNLQVNDSSVIVRNLDICRTSTARHKTSFFFQVHLDF